MKEIVFRHVSKSFAGKPVLKDLSLTLPKGITCLTAPSGAGKTTLLRLILGLEAPDAGEIRGVSPRAAVLFQEDRLVDSLTVRANLRLSLGAAYQPQAAQALLSRMGLSDVLPKRVETLSGGMRRRVALARALLCPAPVLLMDEPCKGLDMDSRRQVLSCIGEAARGRVTLLITHDPLDCEVLSAARLSIPFESTDENPADA